jgi:hypothetical protein
MKLYILTIVLLCGACYSHIAFSQSSNGENLNRNESAISPKVYTQHNEKAEKEHFDTTQLITRLSFGTLIVLIRFSGICPRNYSIFSKGKALLPSGTRMISNI